MCELLGISSDQPLNWSVLLGRFSQRGGVAADNPDGWGFAYAEGDAWHVHKAPEAAAGSAEFTRLAHTATSDLLIAHVRKANPVTACLYANTHPFVRTCCGQQWVFAHNGKVPEIVDQDGCCHPVLSQPLGETDSEHAFCYLLDEIAAVFADDALNSTSFWLQTVALIGDSIAHYGQFNFLMSDGIHLLAYGHDRLYRLRRHDEGIATVLIASEPLTDDGSWEPFSPGELLVARQGEVVTVMRAQHAEGTAAAGQCLRG
jgi:glutamine amidotransferase